MGEEADCGFWTGRMRDGGAQRRRRRGAWWVEAERGGVGGSTRVRAPYWVAQQEEARARPSWLGALPAAGSARPG